MAGSGEKPSLIDEKPAFIFDLEGACWYRKGSDFMSKGRLSASCFVKKRVLSFSISFLVPYFPESNSSLNAFYIFFLLFKQENVTEMSITSFKVRVYSIEEAHQFKASKYG